MQTNILGTVSATVVKHIDTFLKASGLKPKDIVFVLIDKNTRPIVFVDTHLIPPVIKTEGRIDSAYIQMYTVVLHHKNRITAKGRDTLYRPELLRATKCLLTEAGLRDDATMLCVSEILLEVHHTTLSKMCDMKQFATLYSPKNRQEMVDRAYANRESMLKITDRTGQSGPIGEIYEEKE